eukprot:3912562-Prymnesium_polylepis.1
MVWRAVGSAAYGGAGRDSGRWGGKNVKRSPQQRAIELWDAPGCAPEHSGMPTHHSPLRSPSSRTAT